VLGLSPARHPVLLAAHAPAAPLCSHDHVQLHVLRALLPGLWLTGQVQSLRLLQLLLLGSLLCSALPAQAAPLQPGPLRQAPVEVPVAARAPQHHGAQVLADASCAVARAPAHICMPLCHQQPKVGLCAPAQAELAEGQSGAQLTAKSAAAVQGSCSAGWLLQRVQGCQPCLAPEGWEGAVGSSAATGAGAARHCSCRAAQGQSRQVQGCTGWPLLGACLSPAQQPGGRGRARAPQQRIGRLPLLQRRLCLPCQQLLQLLTAGAAFCLCRQHERQPGCAVCSSASSSCNCSSCSPAPRRPSAVQCSRGSSSAASIRRRGTEAAAPALQQAQQPALLRWRHAHRQAQHLASHGHWA
jgi:hypothetical protein